MISILIPVYNVFVGGLAGEIANQLKATGIQGEVVVVDDCSEEDYRVQNRSIASFEHVRYKELQRNLGRIHVRQCLAGLARYDHLLFLDADSQIISPRFIEMYWAHHKDAEAIVGGRVYSSTPPDNPELFLHWKYGSLREAKYPRRSFHSNNFLIRKSRFFQLQFPEYLSGYGHEDTWMGMELERQHCTVAYLENPVLHLGLEPRSVFLNKTANAIANLHQLCNRFDASLLRKHVRMIVWVHVLQKMLLIRPFRLLLQLTRGLVQRNLYSHKPALILFDLFRLDLFIRKLPDEG